jgi:hypothetical protein
MASYDAAIDMCWALDSERRVIHVGVEWVGLGGERRRYLLGRTARAGGRLRLLGAHCGGAGGQGAPRAGCVVRLESHAGARRGQLSARERNGWRETTRGARGLDLNTVRGGEVREGEHSTTRWSSHAGARGLWRRAVRELDG